MLGKHLFGPFVIALYFLLGVLVVSDYGVSWDEPFQHRYGKAIFEYVFDGNQSLHQHNSRYHGPFFQFILYSAEKLLNLTDPGSIYRLRHWLTFLCSFFGIILFYRLLLSLKAGAYWAAIGVVFLICSPRIFAQGFYNSKDAVFMYAFIASMLSMLHFLRNTSWKNALIHGVVCGILIDVRILGFFVPMITGIMWGLNLITDPSNLKRAQNGILVFSISTLLFTILFWPTLWHDPFSEVRNAVLRMSDYPWSDSILFEGEFHSPQELPWYYLPKWMLISTPLFITVLGLVGAIGWFFNHRIAVLEKLIPFLWILLPLGLVLWKGATVYDGWRHVYFVYPAVILLSVFGAKFLFEELFRWKSAKLIPIAFAAIPVVWMVNNHPNQQVYFNPLVMKNAAHNYEMDYWGLSYKQAYEWLFDSNPEGPLHVAAANAPGFDNLTMFSSEQRQRIVFVDRDSAEYFLSNLRFPMEFYASENEEYPYTNLVYDVQVNGNVIMTVHRPND